MKKIFYLVSLLVMGSCIVTDDIEPDDLNNTNSGLSLYITFDDQTANDISGNGFNGVVSGTKFISSTPSGQGFAYNIVMPDDLIRIPYNPFKDIDEYSVCMWLRDPSQGLIFNAYGNNTNSNTANYPTMRISENKLYASFDSYSISDHFTYDPATVIQDGNWHYIVITARNEEQKLYVDGSLVATQQTDVYDSHSSEVHFGGVLDGYTGSIMKIDNIRIYNRVITPKEVELIMDQEL